MSYAALTASVYRRRYAEALTDTCANSPPKLSDGKVSDGPALVPWPLLVSISRATNGQFCRTRLQPSYVFENRCQPVVSAAPYFPSYLTKISAEWICFQKELYSSSTCFFTASLPKLSAEVAHCWGRVAAFNGIKHRFVYPVLSETFTPILLWR